jgi:hypothetical protein
MFRSMVYYAPLVLGDTRLTRPHGDGPVQIREEMATVRCFSGSARAVGQVSGWLNKQSQRGPTISKHRVLGPASCSAGRLSLCQNQQPGKSQSSTINRRPLSWEIVG